MSLDFVGAEFFNSQDLGIPPNLSVPSPPSITSSSSVSSETFKLSNLEYVGIPIAFPVLASIEQPFDWGENFIMPTDGTTPTQAIHDPSTLLDQNWIQQYTTHSLAKFPSENSSSFVMTCPLPLCSYQSSELISIWRHITWDHLGDVNKCSRAMTELVEKVVLGAGEQQ